MAKLLIPLGLLVVGAAVWFALAPVDTPQRGPSAQPATVASTAPVADDDDEPDEAPVVERAVIADPARGPKVENALPADRPAPRADPATGRVAGADPDPRPQAPDGTRYGRRHDTPMPPMKLATVQRTVRQFYGNLPASGRVPAKVTLDEVFSDDVIRALNYPPNSRIKEFGHYAVTDVKGYKEFLAQPEGEPMPLGITVVTPDGQELRDYLMLNP